MLRNRLPIVHSKMKPPYQIQSSEHSLFLMFMKATQLKYERIYAEHTIL